MALQCSFVTFVLIFRTNTHVKITFFKPSIEVLIFNEPWCPSYPLYLFKRTRNISFNLEICHCVKKHYSQGPLFRCFYEYFLSVPDTLDYDQLVMFFYWWDFAEIFCSQGWFCPYDFIILISCFDPFWHFDFFFFSIEFITPIKVKNSFKKPC